MYKSQKVISLKHFIQAKKLHYDRLLIPTRRVSMSSTLNEQYGSMVFNDVTMQEYLSEETYVELREVIQNGKTLDLHIANDVADAMKNWALDRGATHYTHWFQPLTGVTSEKHDSFITPKADGTSLLTFSGKDLIQSEPDASSFPSGGLRSTFEARGYTAWDPTSPAFIKDEVLCIPTAFISYNGEALDKKTPLLRSIVALDKQAKRVLELFGEKPVQVSTTVGAEQEYFIIKREDFAARPDLVLCGRTLFGCEPSKGQELEEHYFGVIHPDVNSFMTDLDEQLWQLDVPAQTKHNEVAPCQHELAPSFESATQAIDHNLLTMEKMKTIAAKHDLACLLHEKPFDYVNGSGKHDNWSISADGKNLLNPGKNPENNLQFLTFLTCVIAAVDEHQDLLRASVASAGNDHRLGANEAPPAIISIFLGEELEAIVDALIKGKTYVSHDTQRMDLGVPQLADVDRDNTDRNRTSPFAFTGNKFEFRMCGSRQNLSDPNMVLNTAVAEQLDNFANALQGSSAKDFEQNVRAWITETLSAHARIIFNGNGYSDDWEKEAQERGLLNLRTTPDALPCLIQDKNIALFEKYGVLNANESQARYVAKAKQYAKMLHIEASTMVYMARHLYLPAISKYSAQMAQGVATKASLNIASPRETELVQKLTEGFSLASQYTEELNELNKKGYAIENCQEQDDFYRDHVLGAMDKLRFVIDGMEKICSHDVWPVPSYNHMLFYI